MKSLKEVASALSGKETSKNRKETQKRDNRPRPVNDRSFEESGSPVIAFSLSLPSGYNNPPSHRPLDGAKTRHWEIHKNGPGSGEKTAGLRVEDAREERSKSVEWKSEKNTIIFFSFKCFYADPETSSAPLPALTKTVLCFSTIPPVEIPSPNGQPFV